MIGKLTYDQVLTFSKELRTEALKVEQLSRDRGIQELVDFSDAVEAYSKFLENTVELNRDADKALEGLAKLK